MRVDDRAFAVDVLAIVVISGSLLMWSDNLTRMTTIVAICLVARMAIWIALPIESRGLPRKVEVALFVACILIGAFNDWSSVTRHRIYDYTVPTDLPGISHIPVWMLLYWGLILRFILTLSSWHRLALPRPRDTVLGRPKPWLRVAILVAVVVATRQCIYRAYLDPVLSWLPFLLAHAVVLLVLGLDRARIRFIVAVTLIGPAVEVLYIQIGGLHAYHLGWFGGVPLWIALWWGLAAVIWGEVATRVLALLRPRVEVPAPVSPLATR